MTFGMDVGWRRRAVRELRLPGTVAGDRPRTAAPATSVASSTRRGLSGGGVRLLPRHVGERAHGRAARRGRHPAAAAGRRIGGRGHVRVRVAQRGLARELFAELARVVRPGDGSRCSDASRPDNAVMRAGHSVYFNRAVPMIGGLISDRDAYAYLPKSMAYLPAPDEMVRMLADAGFADADACAALGRPHATLHRDARVTDGHPDSGFGPRSSLLPSTSWRPAPARSGGCRSCSSAGDRRGVAVHVERHRVATEPAID